MKSLSIKAALVTLTCVSILGVQFGSGRADSPTAARQEMQLPAPVLSSTIPAEVTFGSGVASAETARPFFDYFSWQSFVALNWPAAVGADGMPVRGVPMTGAGVGVGSPGKRVWESYKADWELFRGSEVPPTEWSSYQLNPPNSANPCGNPADSKMLAMVTKMDSVIDGLNQAFSGPLVDQNRNYVRYEIHVNRAYYERVAERKWYLINQQSTKPDRPNEFPDRVIEIKAAWKELIDGKDDPTRFYTVNALIVEPGTPVTCRPARMGLVGFHIANKVRGFREWVWSTFEHVDNVPEGAAETGRKYSFNNGTDTPATPKGFDRRPTSLSDTQPLPLINDAQRNPVQVTRVTPISPTGQVTPTTDQINGQWQASLTGTVWQNYKLVSTQWPTMPNGTSFKVKNSDPQLGPIGTFPANSGSPFPAASVANTTMETYFQSPQSCMRCHYNASQDDFSFLLSERGFKRPTPLSPNLSLTERSRRTAEERINRSPSLRNLRDEMRRQQ